MPETPSKKAVVPQPRTITATLDPAVILDIVRDQGFFYFDLSNILNRPAYRISIKLKESIIGNDGSKKISSLKIFRSLLYLAPNKTIRIPIDTCESYFRHNATKITGHLIYVNADGKRFKSPILHDLGIYKDLTEVIQ
ncbi:MAG: hypothetical protein V3U78_02395 [Thiotrichaceae bacterium]